MRNLHKYIRETHGKEALGELQQWERKEFRQCDYSNHRVFTLRCLSKGLVPVSVRLNSNRKHISIGARNIIRGAERQLYNKELRTSTDWFKTIGNA